MSSALSLALLLLAAQLGGALSSSIQHWCLVLAGLLAGLLLLKRQCSLQAGHLVLVMVLLCFLLLRSAAGRDVMPGTLDPLHLIKPSVPAQVVVLQGRTLTDAPARNGRCRTLVQVDRIDGQKRQGRTELDLKPCSQSLLAGSWIRAEGKLRVPAGAAHPLLSSPAERLAARGSWSQFRAERLQLIRQDWTPLADTRRRIAASFQNLAGPTEGGLLASLVIGGAQVPLPFELRQAFRVAGLSHVLAASGFHLSVLLGATMAFGNLLPRRCRLPLAAMALLTFLLLAGAQPSVLRAVLMGMAAVLIRESGGKQRPIGVLLATLLLMLLVNPGLARSIGFQLSAAATAGLVLSAEPLQRTLAQRLPGPLQRLAPALAVPVAAMAWTLPLQFLHFGAIPLYGLVANLLSAPLVGVLTISAMGLALLAILLPQGLAAVLLPWISWPVQKLASLLIAFVAWISSWPGAQLLTGRPQAWLVLLLVLGLLPWLLPSSQAWRFWQGSCWQWRWRGIFALLLCCLAQAGVQSRDGLVAVHQYGRHWLLARHRGRAALLSSHGDQRSCRLAQRLSQVHGHRRLDWVMVLDPLPVEDSGCWQQLSSTVQAEHQGLAPLQPGQRLVSAGLELRLLDPVGQALRLSAGRQSWSLFPTSQSLSRWQALLQDRGVPDSHAGKATASTAKAVWLGFRPTTSQQRWLQRRSLRILAPAL